MNEQATAAGAGARTVEVRINGRPRAIPEALSVKALLEHLELRPELVVVERNLEILDKGAYDRTEVVAGDTLELVHFVGGG